MNELTVVLIVYGLLQVGSLILLPKWWKIAAIPSLWFVVIAVDIFRTGFGTWGDVIMQGFAAFACVYLSVVWIIFGVTRLVRRQIPHRTR